MSAQRWVAVLATAFAGLACPAPLDMPIVLTRSGPLPEPDLGMSTARTACGMQLPSSIACLMRGQCCCGCGFNCSTVILSMPPVPLLRITRYGPRRSRYGPWPATGCLCQRQPQEAAVLPVPSHARSPLRTGHRSGAWRIPCASSSRAVVTDICASSSIARVAPWRIRLPFGPWALTWLPTMTSADFCGRAPWPRNLGSPLGHGGRYPRV